MIKKTSIIKTAPHRIRWNKLPLNRTVTEKSPSLQDLLSTILCLRIPSQIAKLTLYSTYHRIPNRIHQSPHLRYKRCERVVVYFGRTYYTGVAYLKSETSFSSLDISEKRTSPKTQHWHDRPLNGRTTTDSSQANAPITLDTPQWPSA